MSGRPTPLVRVARVAAAVSVLPVLLAGTAHGAAASRTAVGRPDLAGALLTVRDMPAGYTRFTPRYEPYDASSAPECSRTLDELEAGRSKRPGVRYASVAFKAADDLGPFVVENLRYYERGSAKREFGRVTRTLAKCREFVLTYRQAPANTSTMTVQRVRFHKVATQTWAAWVTVTVREPGRRAWTTGDMLVLARHRRSLVVLSRYGFKEPSPSSVIALARRAVAKVRALKD
jgi:hypothetical protein